MDKGVVPSTIPINSTTAQETLLFHAMYSKQVSPLKLSDFLKVNVPSFFLWTRPQKIRPDKRLEEIGVMHPPVMFGKNHKNIKRLAKLWLNALPKV